MFYELAQLAIGNLSRARARLAMTAGGVLVGTAAVILLIALTIGLQQSAEAGIGNSAELTEVYVYQMWMPDIDVSTLPEMNREAVQQFWQIPGVQVVIPTTYLQGGTLWVGDLMGGGQIMGVDPALLPYMNIPLAEGSYPLNPGEAIVGVHVGDYFSDPEDMPEEGEEWQPTVVDLYAAPAVELELMPFTAEGGSERRITMNFTGKIQEGAGNGRWDYTIIMPINDVIAYNAFITGQEYDPETFRFDQITVRATSRETTLDVIDAIRALGYGADGMGEYLRQMNSFFKTMRMMLGGMGGVALLVAAFGVANTMTMAILERTKEIGLMKAIGATDQDVMSIFLIEAALVGLSGGSSGIALSLFLQNAINKAVANVPQDSAGAQFIPFINTGQLGGNLIVIPTELIIFALTLATLVGIGAGLYPAWRAAHMPPVVALKQE